jgi:hypothetical protein
MDVPVTCDCGHHWHVSPDLVGGLTNCPHCGKAAAVAGLRDPFWRVLQGIALVVWVLLVATLYTNFGLTWALIGGLALAAIYGLTLLLL